MSTLTLTRTLTLNTHADLARAFDAGDLVWSADMLVPAPTPKRTPAQIKTHVAEVRATMIAETETTPTQDVFQASGAQLRSWGFTPTGRERKGGEAARAEITRRAARKVARKVAR